jgi:hypothetical protein
MGPLPPWLKVFEPQQYCWHPATALLLYAFELGMFQVRSDDKHHISNMYVHHAPHSTSAIVKMDST